MNFKDTKFAGFLKRAQHAVVKNGGDVAAIGLKFATGNVSGAIEETMDLLKGDDDTLSKELLSELQLKKEEFQLEKYKLEVDDRNSARKREIEIRKSGGQDVMMIVTGSVGLLAFLVLLFSVLFIDLPEKNKSLIFHFLGVSETVVIAIFTYYYGSSKGSADKQKELEKKGN